MLHLRTFVILWPANITLGRVGQLKYNRGTVNISDLMIHGECPQSPQYAQSLNVVEICMCPMCPKCPMCPMYESGGNFAQFTHESPQRPNV